MTMELLYVVGGNSHLNTIDIHFNLIVSVYVCKKRNSPRTFFLVTLSFHFYNKIIKSKVYTIKKGK